MKQTTLAALIFYIIFLSSCGKDPGSSPTPPDPPDPPSGDTANVYITGFTTAANGKQVATLWKDGKAVYLTDSTYDALGKSVFVSGADVYVAGFIVAPNGNTIAVYWKNGNMTKLTDQSTSSSAFEIIVSGATVYVAGFIVGENGDHLAAYWKNGTAVTLGKQESYATSIAVSGNNVYVGGSVTGQGNYSVATIWKNGESTDLMDTLHYSSVNAIVINDTNVHAACSVTTPPQENRRAVYWKNGNIDTLPGNTNFIEASDLIVKGNDVYVTGRTYTSYFALKGWATYWKNGSPHNLTEIPFDILTSDATAIAVAKNDDVYVVGSVVATTLNYVATYWKNGTEVNLAPAERESYATSVFVVDK